jgi:sterol desaturase/sphingolipid hydroxylase (fatty acid hydroxylase superfamily)
MGKMNGMVLGVLVTMIVPAIALAICIAIESIVPRTRYGVRERIMGTYFIMLFPVCGALFTGPMAAAWIAIFGNHVLIDLSWLPTSVVLVLVLLYRDFLNYWQHRFEHWAFWPVHAVHHSQTRLHAANGYAHPFQMFTEFVLIAVPLSFLDTGSAITPFWLAIVSTIQPMVIHSPLRLHLGPLRRLFNDNRFHRIHHSVEERHFGKNYGTLFTIWDQIFGTAYFPAGDEWPDVGVDGLSPPTTPMSVMVYPFQMIGHTLSARVKRKRFFQSPADLAERDVASPV